MKVRDLMTADVKSCNVHDLLNRAAQIMWDNNCGCVPVVDAEDRLIGVLTDRDVCMAAYTQGAPLGTSTVRSAMATQVHSCAPGDSLSDVLKAMRTHRVRRLPVVDSENLLVGIISLNDIAREAERERAAKMKKRQVRDTDIAQTLGAICTQERENSAAA